MLTLCHNYFGVPTNSKNNRDSVQHDIRQYALGVSIIIIVVLLWVLSSEFTKYIYVEKNLDRPFLVTYVRSSLLFVYLLVLCFSPPTRDPCRPADYTQLLEHAETDDENNLFNNESGNSLGDSTFVPVRAGETTDSDDAAPRAVRFNKVAEVRVMSAAQAGEALLARLSWAASVRASEYAQRRAAAAATRRHLRLALVFCIPWFISNYLYRLSLAHTSASSANIYISTSGAFGLILGALFAQSPSDRFNLSKWMSVLLTFSGVAVLVISENLQEPGLDSSGVGAAAAMGAAGCYGMHLVLVRHELRRADPLNEPLLLGLVGCACFLLAWTGGGILAALGSERASLPPHPAWFWLLLDAGLGPLLIETVWLWGISLTSPTTATALMWLTVPLSACVDMVAGLAGGGVWRGAAAVLACAGGAAAVYAPPATHSLRDWLARRRGGGDGFEALRNMSELDEQSEALMSPEEPT